MNGYTVGAQAIEDSIASVMKRGNSEKSFIDKVFARDDVDRLREILSKKELTEEDLRVALYQLNSGEAKLVNYSDWERYVMLKFHIWIRADVKILQLFLHTKKTIETELNDKNCSWDDEAKEQMRHSLDEFKKMYVEIIQSLSDIFLHIQRSSLSINGLGFKEALQNRFEIGYKADVKPMASPKSSGG